MILCNLANKTREGKLAEKKLSRLLVLANLAKSDGFIELDNNVIINVVYNRVAHTSKSRTPPTLRTSTIVYLNNVVIQCIDVYRVN